MKIHVEVYILALLYYTNAKVHYKTYSNRRLENSDNFNLETLDNILKKTHHKHHFLDNTFDGIVTEKESIHGRDRPKNLKKEENHTPQIPLTETEVSDVLTAISDVLNKIRLNLNQEQENLEYSKDRNQKNVNKMKKESNINELLSDINKVLVTNNNAPNPKRRKHYKNHNYSLTGKLLHSIRRSEEAVNRYYVAPENSEETNLTTSSRTRTKESIFTTPLPTTIIFPTNPLKESTTKPTTSDLVDLDDNLPTYRNFIIDMIFGQIYQILDIGGNFFKNFLVHLLSKLFELGFGGADMVLFIALAIFVGSLSGIATGLALLVGTGFIRMIRFNMLPSFVKDTITGPLRFIFQRLLGIVKDFNFGKIVKNGYDMMIAIYRQVMAL